MRSFQLFLRALHAQTVHHDNGGFIAGPQSDPTFVETYGFKGYPKRDISFAYSGWGGDRVTGGGIEARLSCDLVAGKTSLATIPPCGKHRFRNLEIRELQ
ncbi:MAG: hypothetical protein FJW30_21330 [Acidobacteria bacterium]|nr:hypothetical protein [Acidobacteriota bacterium]